MSRRKFLAHATTAAAVTSAAALTTMAATTAHAPLHTSDFARAAAEYHRLKAIREAQVPDSAAEDAAADAMYGALDVVITAQPGALGEFVAKLEILALVYQEGPSFADVLDIAARDLWALGARHDLSQESARLKRDWRFMKDDPDFHLDRSNARWAVIDGRMRAVV